MRKVLTSILISISVILIQAQQLDYEFFPEGKYDSSIPKPFDVIGYNIGDKPITYHDMVEYLKIVAGKSPLVTLHHLGETHQGRKLYYVVVTSENNRSRLDEIKNNLAKLADPRKINNGDAENIINGSPAVAFMMYSIHGNESSGTDASIQLTYQLAAGTDDPTKKLLDDLVIIIYPMENPDGRERFVNQVETWSGEVRNSDTQSFPHSGVWPSGRTNHYHFDLNRDWFILSQPESRSRVKIILEWNPQLVVDAHEMGSFSSFLFNPPRDPVNPNMHAKIQNWWKIYAGDQSRALDKFGWSYYTREWLEEWYPGYGSSWPSYGGAVSILYEQARTSGIEVKRPDGKTLTFKEAIHHQFISSLANLTTLADNKIKILADYYEIRKEAVGKSIRNDVEAFIFDEGENKSRVEKLVEVLTYQGIEVYKAEDDFNLTGVNNYWSDKPNSRKFSRGTYIVPVKQPFQNLVNAILEFDTRMTNKFLKWERESLEKGEGTQLYEVTAWSMPLAYGIDTYISKSGVNVKMQRVNLIEKSAGELVNPNPLYGYLVKYKDDNSIKALLKFFDHGYKVQCSDKTFSIEGNAYNRGTLLIRKTENPNSQESDLVKIAKETGVQIVGVNTGLSKAGSDLGGDYFTLLQSPRTAMLVDQAINMNNYGAMRYLFDYELGLRVSTLNAGYVGNYDLRKYNVIIIPSVWGGASRLEDALGKTGLKNLKDWVSDGGTLIAVENSAAALTDSSIQLSKVQLRRKSISKIDDFNEALEKEQSIKSIIIDSVEIWEGKIKKEEKSDNEKKQKVDAKELAKRDSDNLKFMPQGAILKANLNEEHWLNFGVGSRLPVLYNTSYVYLSKPPVQTAARIDDAKNMRLSGLLWPEARERIEHGAYLTREPNGKGQVILFADEPNFRSYFYGTAKQLINAVILGPGYGARQPVEW